MSEESKKSFKESLFTALNLFNNHEWYEAHDAFEEGVATFYALKNAEDRGVYFIKPGVKVYKGMIIGENNRPQDLELNICKTKQLTNMRSAGAEELDTLQSPVDITLERALEYIGPDEMLEVTPDSIRMRKINKKKKN